MGEHPALILTELVTNFWDRWLWVENAVWTEWRTLLANDLEAVLKFAKQQQDVESAKR
jgi:hypothetical protein